MADPVIPDEAARLAQIAARVGDVQAVHSHADVRWLLARVERLTAELAGVRELHQPFERPGAVEPDSIWCKHCIQPWPCATAGALRSAGGQAEPGPEPADVRERINAMAAIIAHEYDVADPDDEGYRPDPAALATVIHDTFAAAGGGGLRLPDREATDDEANAAAARQVVRWRGALDLLAERESPAGVPVPDPAQEAGR